MCEGQAKCIADAKVCDGNVDCAANQDISDEICPREGYAGAGDEASTSALVSGACTSLEEAFHKAVTGTHTNSDLNCLKDGVNGVFDGVVADIQAGNAGGVNTFSACNTLLRCYKLDPGVEEKLPSAPNGGLKMCCKVPGHCTQKVPLSTPNGNQNEWELSFIHEVFVEGCMEEMQYQAGVVDGKWAKDLADAIKSTCPAPPPSPAENCAAAGGSTDEETSNTGPIIIIVVVVVVAIGAGGFGYTYYQGQLAQAL